MEGGVSRSGEAAAISPVILTGAPSDTMVAAEANRPDDVQQEVKPCRMQLYEMFCLTLTLTASALRNRPRRHPGVPAAEPEERCRSRPVAERKAAVRPKAVVEMSRAAQARPQPSRKTSCSYTQMGVHRERPASVHVNQQVHLDLLPIRLTPPRKGRLFCRIADRKTKAEEHLSTFRSRPRLPWLCCRAIR
jgi:hypothetical protein